MGITLGSNFTVNTGLPLDDRLVVADITARNAIPSGRRYEGMVVHVQSDGKNYQLVGGVLDANWSSESFGAPADPDMVTNTEGISDPNEVPLYDDENGKVLKGSGLLFDPTTTTMSLLDPADVMTFENPTTFGGDAVFTAPVINEDEVLNEGPVRHDDVISFGSSTDNQSGAEITIAAPTTKIVRLTNPLLESIAMIAGGPAGQELTLVNETGVDVIILDQTGATVTEQILTGVGNVTLYAGTAMEFFYNSMTGFWTMKGGSALTVATTQEPDTIVEHVGAGVMSSSTNYAIMGAYGLTMEGDGFVLTSSAAGGDVFTATKDMTVHCNFSCGSNSSASSYIVAVMVNDVTMMSNRTLYNTANTTTKIPHVSWSGKLVAGDRLSFFCDLEPDTCYLSILGQGVLKAVTTNLNQKVKLASHQVRFEAASAKGTTDTAIIKFDNQTELRGDGFIVNNTAANGTVITITKAGLLSVHAAVGLGASGNTISISKNQAVLTAYPTGAEVIGIGSSSGGVGFFSSATAIDVPVQVGDVIRASTATTVSSSAYNKFYLSLREQEVQVSVSNTLPQFTENDVVFEAAGGTAVAITANTENIPFTATYDPLGTWNGTVFTAPSTGEYSVAGGTYASASVTRSQVIYVNGVAVKSIGVASSTATLAMSGTIRLNQGDLLSIRTTVGFTISNDGTYHHLKITKLGKPNVEAVDVTPFVNVPQTEMQSTYRQATESKVSGSVLTGVPNRSQGSGVYSHDPTTGIFTVLKGGIFNLACGVTTGASGNSAGLIYINGSLIFNDYSYNANGYTSISKHSEYLPAGSTFYFTSFSSAVATTSNYYSVSATAKSDQVVTELDTVSSDTISFAYAGSASYTLATLANAPVGTFITFTYAGGSNTRTQTTTAPTQTVSDMNANGIFVTARAYDTSSTAALPSVVAIQIGKGLKGHSLSLYKTTGKATSGSLEYAMYGNSSLIGAFTNYNEVSGILIIDAGYSVSSAITSHSFHFSDASLQTNGYVTFNASMNPALTGINSNVVAARAINTAGTSIANTGDVVVPWSTSGQINNNAIVNADGKFYAPQTGIYRIAAAIRFASSLYAAGNASAIRVYKNGTLYSTIATARVDAALTVIQGLSGTDTIRLMKGDYIDIRVANARGAGATLLSTTAGDCWMSIFKLGGIN